MSQKLIGFGGPAPGAARRANARRRHRLTALSPTPLITDAVAGQPGYGLALGGRF